MKLEATVFKRKHVSSKYHVEYHLFNEQSEPTGPPTIPTNIKNKKGLISLKYVCFSGLMGTFSANKLNRICYKPKVNKILKSKDVKRWIDIAKAGRLLPPYVEFKHLKKTFLLQCDVPPSLLYVYLCTLRDLEEEPDFVRITSYLVEKGMDIHAAIVTASTITINNLGHHYLRLNAPYSEKPITSIKVCLGHIFQLKKFLMNPSTYDKRNCASLNVDTYSSRQFSAQNTIGNISSTAVTVPIADLFDKNIVDMLSSGKYSKKLYDKHIAAKKEKKS
jgi:hypothetical protein